MGANQTTLSSTASEGVGRGGAGNINIPPPPNQDRIPEHFNDVSDLKQYAIKQRLLPGSGRMMRTYRIRSVNSNTNANTNNFTNRRNNNIKNIAPLSSTDTISDGRVGNGVVAVCKSMYVHDSNTRIVQEQMQELQRIKEALHDQPHVMPFEYWTTTNSNLQEITKHSTVISKTSRQSSSTANNKKGIKNESSSKLDSNSPDCSGDLEGDSSISAVSTSLKGSSAQNNDSPSIVSKSTSTFARPPATTSSKTTATYFAAAVANATVGSTDTLRSENKYFSIYLLRSYVHTTLSDRLASRPFLTHVEKLYISHQILEALDYMHSKNVVHGFLTTENVGLTSWNYVVLVDIASYKAHVSLPDDDPSDYLYYYHSELVHSNTNTSSSTATNNDSAAAKTTTAINREKRCYIAPERFISKTLKARNNKKNNESTVIIEEEESIGTQDSKKYPKNEREEEEKKAKEVKMKDCVSDAPFGQNTVVVNSSEKLCDRLKPSMDIFSCGCVLIETFLNGERALDLGQLMEYRRVNSENNDNDSNSSMASILTPSIQQKLNKIESSSLRAACKHMLHINPNKRLTAKQYLERLSNIFPRNIFEGLNNIIIQAPRSNVQDHAANIITPDTRIAIAAYNYGEILWETIGVQDLIGINYFNRLLGPTIVSMQEKNNSEGCRANNIEEKDLKQKGKDLISTSKNNQTTSSKTTQIAVGASFLRSSHDSTFAETEALLKQLETMDFKNNTDNNNRNKDVVTKVKTTTTTIGGDSNINKLKNNVDHTRKKKNEIRSVCCQNSIVIYVQFILSNIRHVQRPTSKIVGLQLLSHLCKYLGHQNHNSYDINNKNKVSSYIKENSDNNDHSEVLLQRIVPIVMSILEKDSDSVVKSLAMGVLTSALHNVQSFPPSDSNIFSQYIFKRISHLLTDPVLIVRLSFINNMPTIAQTALRFLDISYAVQMYEAVGNNSHYNINTNVTRNTAVSGGAKANSKNSSNADTRSQLPDVFGDDITKLLDKESEKSTNIKTNENIHNSNAKKQHHMVSSTSSSSAGAMAGDRSGSADATMTCDVGKTLIKSTYEEDLAALQETVSRWVVHITTDQSEHSSPMKRALLNHIDSLCMFFSLDGIMTYILPQILALFNDRKDYLLRVSLFERLPSVCYIIGRAATEEFVLPCLEAGLIDPIEHVISCALKCLSELIELGLLSRLTLIGNMTNTSNMRFTSSIPTNLFPLSSHSGLTRGVSNVSSKKEERKSIQDGIINKYSTLLVHPSVEVRHNAITTINTACVALGSPDSEIYVVRILKPFLRFQPSSHHLRTLEGMTMCLYPPWDRVNFEKELREFSSPSLPTESRGASTSINVDNDGYSTGDTGGKAKKEWIPAGIYQLIKNNDDCRDRSDESKEQMAKKIEAGEQESTKKLDINTLPGPQINRVKDYLRMLGRYGKLPIKENYEMSISPLLMNGRLEGSLKLTQKIKIPRQDVIGSSPRSIPSWYSLLREEVRKQSSANSDIFLPESSAIRSVSALGKVYGLSIMNPGDNDSRSDFLKQGDDLAVVKDNSDEEMANFREEEFCNILKSDESKIIEAVCSGEWGSETHLDPSLLDTSLLVSKLKALKVPPLPPNLGKLNLHGVANDTTLPPTRALAGGTSSSDWKPKVDTFVATSSIATGHTAPVIRIAVSLDQSFFVSGSYDGTCRVWEMPQLERSVGVLESSTTYSHVNANNSNSSTVARINDLAIIEGGHSVVSGASNGSVHAWRVDLLSSTKNPALSATNNFLCPERSRVIGTSVVRELDPCEGEVLAVSHFNKHSASIMAFATQKGFVHSWDLRCCEEPFVLKHGPDIGYLTSMTLGSDRNWLVTGTSRGFLTLWDLRFHNAVKLWRHSREAPITRLAAAFLPPPQTWGNRINAVNESKPFIFAACGSNESAMFDITDGSCRECFRTVSHEGGAMASNLEDIPSLQEVPISSSFSVGNSFLMTNGFANKNRSCLNPSPTKAINAMVGSIGANDQSYLITGGGDSQIRFWDFSTPSRCHIVSGYSSIHHRPAFERIDFTNPCRLMLCRQSKLPSNINTVGTRISKKSAHGLQTNMNRHHSDAVLDLKIVNNALISCSRDCTIKIWR